MRLFGTLESGQDVAVLAGAFNPPTVAHLQLALSAQPLTGQVLFALPERFPHKDVHGASLDLRVAMLTQIDPRFPVAVTSGGLFIEIARELRLEAGCRGRISFICGRDAAERIVNWNYAGSEPDISSQLEEFELLVAEREGVYSAPHSLRERVRELRLPASFDHVSSTEVRDRIRAGVDWRSLVPESIAELVQHAYQ